MPKLTLLEMVQDILNEMDSDSVNSISDTVESEQVAQILKSSFYEFIEHRNWPHLRKLIQLESLSEPTKPNYLKIPDNVNKLELFKYDKYTLANPKTTLQDVKWKEPDDFLRYVSARDSTLTSITTVTDFSGVKLLIINDKPPTYWTSFDDTYVITDAYDSGVDTTLMSSKTQCIAYTSPDWVMDDDAIPDLPSEAFPAFVEEAKSAAFLSLKQVANQKAEQRATRQNRWLSRQSWRAHGGILYPDYGRKSSK